MTKSAHTCAERKVAISHQILTALGLTPGACIIGTPLNLTISLQKLDFHLAQLQSLQPVREGEFRVISLKGLDFHLAQLQSLQPVRERVLLPYLFTGI